MKKSFFAGPVALGVALLASTASVWAQPDPNNAPKGENPPNWQRGQNGNLTPEQRAAAQKQRREQNLRQMMTMAEITDKMTQDALLAFVEAEEKARGPVRDAARKVVTAVGAGAMGQPKVDDAAIATAMEAYRAAVKADEARRDAALDNLDNTINWRTMPRVDAFLTLLGYTSDPGIMGGGMGGMMGMMGGGGFGGFGGGFGMGGRGGNGPGGRGGRGPGGRGGRQGGGRGGNNAAPAPAPADDADDADD